MHRKIVIVLFREAVGYTTLGDSSDPEALRGLLADYYEGIRPQLTALRERMTR